MFFFYSQNLLLAHDSVARQEVKSAANDEEPPDYFNMPNISDGGASVKLVHLEKTTEPLVTYILYNKMCPLCFPPLLF